MRKWLILLSLWSLCASAAPVWTWVDADGTVHYSDRPVPGARQIELPEFGSRAATPSPPAAARPAVQPPAEERSERAEQRYRTFQIVSPTQQETLWNIGGELQVSLVLEPPLQQGHTIDVYLDGERRNLNTTSLQFTVPEVFRGTHTLQAAIIDSRGQVVLRSLPVQFMVMQTSILNPNNPNRPVRP